MDSETYDQLSKAADVGVEVTADVGVEVNNENTDIRSGCRGNSVPEHQSDLNNFSDSELDSDEF